MKGLRSFLLLVILILACTYMGKSHGAEYGISLKCKVGYTDEVLNIHHRRGYKQFSEQFKAGGKYYTVMIEDVRDLDPVSDYMVISDGKYSFTQPLYCTVVK